MRRRNLRPDRVFRHMAKDVSDVRIVYVPLHLLPDDPTSLEGLLEKYMGLWMRLVSIKHGGGVPVDVHSEYQYDYDRYRIVGRVLPEKYR